MVQILCVVFSLMWDIYQVLVFWKTYGLNSKFSHYIADKEEPKVSKWEFLNDFSIEEIQNIMRPVLQKVQSQGSVPVRNLSSSVRKKESATDMRMSSQGIGILGGSLLGLVFLIIFVSDLVIIKVQLTALFKNLSRLCKTNNPRRINDFGEK